MNCESFDYRIFSENLTEQKYENQDFSYYNFLSIDFSDKHFVNCSFNGAVLHKCKLGNTLFEECEITNISFSRTSENKRGSATFKDCNISYFETNGCNLCIRLTNCNIHHADFSGASMHIYNCRGVGTKLEEVAFAKHLLAILESGKGELGMGEWHTCETTHCIAGWYAPDKHDPSYVASTALPTLARYFYSREEEALAALKRVANGQETAFTN